MIGNDVVWLTDPANLKRSSDQRLVDRILTVGEKDIVSRSSDPDRTLWSLWAAKEAAFKALAKETPSLVFSPQSLKVDGTPPLNQGIVTSGNLVLPVRWFYGDDWVEAVAGAPMEEILHYVLPMPGDGSSHVRALAVGTLPDGGWAPGGHIEGRPPRYVVDGVDQSVDLSLSHDGPYVAVAFRRCSPTGPQSGSPKTIGSSVARQHSLP